MVYGCIIGALALLAQARFTNTINLGALLVGILIVVGFAWASVKDKRSDRWEKLYHLADAERKEIQEKHNEAMEAISSLREVNSNLEALQMPTRVIEIMTESVRLINDQAAARQEELKLKVSEHLDNHESRAQARTQLIIETQDRLIDVLNEVSKKIQTIPHDGD